MEWPDTVAATPQLATLQPAPALLERPELRWAFVFIWLFTFMIYARPEDMFPAIAPLHLTLVFGTCASLMSAGAIVFRGVRVPWTSETKLIALLTFWFACGVPFAFWRSGSLHVLMTVWFKTVLAFTVLTLTLLTLERIRLLLWAIILSELLATSFSILQPSKALWVGERIYGANTGFLGWNFLGIAAAMSIPYIAAMFVGRRSLLATCLLVTTSASMLWMLVLTASRGGFLNVIFSTILTFWFVLRGSSRGRLAGMGIGLVLLAATMLAPSVFWDRLGTVWSDSGTSSYVNQFQSGLEQLAAQESTEGRRELLRRSIQFTLEHPLFGLGLGNFNLASGAQHGAEANAWMGTHNTFTQISSEAGLPALLLYLALVAGAIRKMYTIRCTALQNEGSQELTLMAGATLVSLLSFAFGACVAHLAYDYYFFYIVTIACSLGSVARESGLAIHDRTTEAGDLRISPVLV
jgi:O-antigen ligase